MTALRATYNAVVLVDDDSDDASLLELEEIEIRDGGNDEARFEDRRTQDRRDGCGDSRPVGHVTAT